MSSLCHVCLSQYSVGVHKTTHKSNLSELICVKMIIILGFHANVYMKYLNKIYYKK